MSAEPNNSMDMRAIYLSWTGARGRLFCYQPCQLKLYLRGGREGSSQKWKREFTEKTR